MNEKAAKNNSKIVKKPQNDLSRSLRSSSRLKEKNANQQSKKYLSTIVINDSDSDDNISLTKQSSSQKSLKRKKTSKFMDIITLDDDSSNELKLRKKAKNDDKTAQPTNMSYDKNGKSSLAKRIPLKEVSNKRARNLSFDDDNNNSNKKMKQFDNSSKNFKTSEDVSPETRKHIRKLIESEYLETETKRAGKEEDDRRKRLEKRQILYNEIYGSIKLAELVLDFDEKTKEPLLKVDSNLLTKLKPHQINGVKFMWDTCFETLEYCKRSPGTGCILAHCMGLGKTLQVITLTHTLLSNSERTGVHRVLIIAPVSTLVNWGLEYQTWMKYCEKNDVKVYEVSNLKGTNDYRKKRRALINNWVENGGVFIVGYEECRNLINCSRNRKGFSTVVQSAFIRPGPDVVVCDEGHLLKNESTSLSLAVNNIPTKRRIVLTGTPMQNNLQEYYCMIQFIKPNLLGTYKEYLNRFVNPITNGQYTDSTESDIRLMKQRAHVLHSLLDASIQRKDYLTLAPYLPPKYEYVLHIPCSRVQAKLYKFYMTKQRHMIKARNSHGNSHFLQDYYNLRRIWTHPMCLRLHSDEVIIRKYYKETFKHTEEPANDLPEENNALFSESGSEYEMDWCDSNIVHGNIVDASEWWMRMVPDDELDNIFCSPKLVLLFKILQHCSAIGDKMLVFSHSLKSLDVIERFLSLIHQRTQGFDIEENVGDFSGLWEPGVDFFRVDGSRNVEKRESIFKTFNDKNNPRARLLLISTKTGGLGINLASANRVVIFDVSWNPTVDTQSVFRIYRFGQDKMCFIYRFVAMGTMEQKIYERQIVKQSTFMRVIDEHQIDQHYTQSDLLEMYSYELKSAAPREIPIIPNDPVLAELLSNDEQLIFKYHEHDSLLANQDSEKLNDEERKTAWADYEKENQQSLDVL